MTFEKYIAKCFIVKDNKFLVVLDSNKDSFLWDLPGGKNEASFDDWNEDIAKEYIYNEIGLSIDIIDSLDMYNPKINEEHFNIMGNILLCKISKDDKISLNGYTDYKWLPLDKSSIVNIDKIISNRMATWDWKKLIEKTKCL